MMYQFIHHFSNGSISNDQECKDFAAAVDSAAVQFSLLQERGAVKDDIGTYECVEIIHTGTSYTVATLYYNELRARRFALTVNVDPQFIDGNYRCVNLDIVLGGKDFMQQARSILSALADQYLEQYNIPDKSFPLPCTYLNVQDAKRDLQYLVEFIKIADFQLSGNSARHW